MKMKVAMNVFGMLIVLAAAYGGCTTLGVGGERPANEQAFEGASIAMASKYFLDIIDREPTPSKRQIAEELVKTGDDYLAKFHQGTGWTYLGLAEELVSELSNGKFKPQVSVIYGIVLVLLDEIGQEEAQATLGSKSAKDLWTEFNPSERTAQKIERALLLTE